MDEKEKHNSYKDSGWAWMIVLGGFIVNFLVVGTAVKSFGVLFIELQEKYDSKSGVNITIVAVTQSLCLLLGPITNLLAIKITCRKTVFIGGLVMFCGFVLSMFAPGIIYLYFTYGVVVGVGAAMAYSPSIVLVGQYFVKRRGLANGLSVAGSGVGNFASPPLIGHLVDYYGSVSSAFLVLAAFMLHICIAGALLRPTPHHPSPNPPHPPAFNPPHTQQSLVTEVEARSCTANNALPQEDQDCDARRTKQIEMNDDSTIKVVTTNERGDIVIEDKPNKKKTRCITCWASLYLAIHRLYLAIHQQLDLALFQNAIFLLYATAVMLMFCGYPTLYVVMPGHSRAKLDISKQGARYLVSILGIADLIGRILFGFLADLNLCQKRYLFTSCTAISGTAICILPFINNYIGLAALLALIGLFAGGFFTLIAVMLAEKLGIRRLHSAFGLVVMFMGASFIFAAPISGKLFDQTGSWTASFLFSGVAMLVGSALLLLDPLAVEYERNRAARQPHVVIVQHKTINQPSNITQTDNHATKLHNAETS